MTSPRPSNEELRKLWENAPESLRSALVMSDMSPFNAEHFYLAARTALPALLDEIDALAKELAEAKVERDDALYKHGGAVWDLERAQKDAEEELASANGEIERLKDLLAETVLRQSKQKARAEAQLEAKLAALREALETLLNGFNRQLHGHSDNSSIWLWMKDSFGLTPKDIHNCRAALPLCRPAKDICIDCDGVGKYPSGSPCKSCGATGGVAKGDGRPAKEEPPCDV